MIVVVIATFAFAALGMQLSRQLDLPKWIVSVGFLGLAVTLHFVVLRLHEHFIRRSAPELIDDQRGLIHSSATQYVPRWVSHITSIEISVFLAAAFPWIVLAVKGIETGTQLVLN